MSNKNVKHYGVKGMRWGVRRDISAAKAARKDAKSLRDNGYTKEADAVDAWASKLESRVAKATANDAGNLSNAELQSRITRMSLEKNYNRLVSEKNGQSLVRQGLSVTGSIVGNAAKQALTNYLSKQMTGVISNVLGDE